MATFSSSNVVQLSPVGGLLFHDLRRSAVRNMDRAGISREVAMKISGHKTRAIFDRYNIVDNRDIEDAGKETCILFRGAEEMTGYQIDLDTKHSVIRLTVKEETVTEELAEDMYRHLMDVTAKGGPYAAIYDLTTTKHTTIDTDSVRSWGRHHRPAVPHGSARFVATHESMWL